IKLIAKVAIAMNRQEVDDQSDKCETSNNACRYPTICRRSFHAVDLARIAFRKKAFLPRAPSKVQKNFLPRVWIRGIARTCAEAGLSKRNNCNASDHFSYWPRADVRASQALLSRARTGDKERFDSGDHQGNTRGHYKGNVGAGNHEGETSGRRKANAGSDHQSGPASR